MNTILSVNEDAVGKAATWLRKNRNMGFGYDLIPEFEKEFNCKVITDRGFIAPSRVDFQTTENLMMFLLKWS